MKPTRKHEGLRVRMKGDLGAEAIGIIGHDGTGAFIIDERFWHPHLRIVPHRWRIVEILTPPGGEVKL